VLAAHKSSIPTYPPLPRRLQFCGKYSLGIIPLRPQLAVPLFHPCGPGLSMDRVRRRTIRGRQGPDWVKFVDLEDCLRLVR
jgi:hypothetical protein